MVIYVITFYYVRALIGLLNNNQEVKDSCGILDKDILNLSIVKICKYGLKLETWCVVIQYSSTRIRNVSIPVVYVIIFHPLFN